MRKVHLIGVGSIVVLAWCEISRASYCVGYTWDSQKDFCTWSNPATDSMTNAAWEYRAGAPGLDPLCTTLTTWDGSAHGGQGAWSGVTGAAGSQSWIGRDFMKASWPGCGDQCPFLTWVSNVDAPVDVAIMVSQANIRYHATIFLGSTKIGEYGGDNEDFTFMDRLTVCRGDRIFLRIAPEFRDECPQVTVSFKVMVAPEPTTLGFLAVAAVPVLWRRRQAVPDRPIGLVQGSARPR